MSKTLKIGFAVAIVIAIGGSYFYPQVQTVPVAEQVVGGANSGPTTDSSYTASGGYQTYKYYYPLSVATTTPCSIRSPNATSTLRLAALRLTVGSSTATTWRVAVATSTWSFETATRFGAWSLASGAVATFVASSSPVGTGPAADDTGIVIPPNRYITWKYTGASVGDPTLFTGYCAAQFDAI